MAKRRSNKILGLSPTTLAIVGVGAYLLKDKLFPKPTSTTTQGGTIFNPTTPKT
jgi:hypothetical protein